MSFFERIRELLYHKRQDEGPYLKTELTKKVSSYKRKKAKKIQQFPMAHRTLESFYAGQFRPMSLKHRRRSIYGSNL